MNLDTCNPMSVFSHHALQNGHFSLPQLMGYAIGERSLNAGVRNQDLSSTLGGRIAKKDSLNIQEQLFLNARQPFHEIRTNGRSLTYALIIRIIRPVFRAKSQNNLLRQRTVDLVQSSREIRAQRPKETNLLAVKAGKNHAAQGTHYFDNDL